MRLQIDDVCRLRVRHSGGVGGCRGEAVSWRRQERSRVNAPGCAQSPRRKGSAWPDFLGPGFFRAREVSKPMRKCGVDE